MNARIWSKRINGIIGEREANEPISPGSPLMDDQDKSDRNVSKNSIHRGQKVNDWKKVFTCLSPPTVAEFEAWWLLSWLVRSPNGLRPRTPMPWGRLCCRFSMTSTAEVTQIWIYNVKKFWFFNFLSSRDTNDLQRVAEVPGFEEWPRVSSRNLKSQF